MKIQELSEEQKALLPVYAKRGIDVGLSTEPIDREAAEVYARKLMKFLDREYRGTVIVDGPLHAYLASLLLCAFEETDVAQDQEQTWTQIVKQVRDQVQNHIPLWPYMNGQFSSYSVSYLQYLTEVLQIDLPDYTILSDQVQFGIIYPLQNYVIISDRPDVIHMNDNGLLHKDGGPALRYRDGTVVYALNGTIVPEWLATENNTDIDPSRITELDNAQVRAEFVRKVGLERITTALGSETIHETTVVMDTPHNGTWACHYKLLKFRVGESDRVVLQMPNPSVPGLTHMEYVDDSCTTVEQAMNYRLRRDESDIDDENGSDWYLHGDVVVVPRGATKTKRWPKLIA